MLALAPCASNAAVNLPNVALDRGSVSARDLFGMRSNKTNVVFSQPSAAPKIGAAPVRGGDVLIPSRPNSDLWVNSGSAPQPNIAAALPAQKNDWRNDTFVRIDSEYELPEESLLARADISNANDFAFREDSPKIIKPAPLPTKSAKPRAARPAADNRKAQLDNAIARLIAKQQATNIKVARATAAVEKFAAKSEIQPAVAVMAAPEIKPEQQVQRVLATKPVVRVATEEFALKNPDEKSMNKLSPKELKRAFYTSYISENKHLSTYASNSDFDAVSSESWTEDQGFVGDDSLPTTAAQPKMLEIKITFSDGDSSLSKDNFNLLSEYAALNANNPKRAVQISISEDAVKNSNTKKLAAKRLAIIQQTLIDAGILESKIIPVLADRDDNSFVLRVISTDQFQILKQTERDMFGDTKKSTTSKSLSW